MSKMKLKIGEFSQMMQVTVKTLRHYEQKGLLLPDEVDEWTGYRYYSIGQMQKLKDIRDLQRLGFSLDEIKELYEEDSHTPSIRQMTEKIKETEAQLRQLIARRNQLLDWRNSRKEMKTMEKFSIPATSMEPGTRMTRRNGSQSFRYQSNNQKLSASIIWGRHYKH